MASLPIFQEEAKRWLLDHSGVGSLLLPLFMIFILFLSKWWFSSTNSIKKNLPPSPPGLPIIGNLHQIGPLPQYSFKSMSDKYGPLILLHLGSQPAVVATSADAAREVLKTQESSCCGRPHCSFAGIFYYNFKEINFAPYGQHWKNARLTIISLFLSRKKVQLFQSIREEEIGKMVEKIRVSCASSPSVISIHDMLSTLTSDIGSRAAFGKRFSEMDGGSKLKKLVSVSNDMLNVFNIRDYIPWLGWINHLNGLDAKANKVAKDLDECLEKLVEEELERQKINGISSGTTTTDAEGDNYESKDNMLEVLLQILSTTDGTRYVLDRDSIKAVLMDILGGGVDMYVIVEWAMADIVRHKNVMKRLQDEVRGFAVGKSIITEDDLEKLPYVKAAVKETMRFRSPAAIIPRAATKDVNLMGYDISKGTQILVNSWAIARDPKLWKDPEEFRPERFLDSSIDLYGHNYQLIPFGYGRRNCPGATFALLIFELAIANLFLNFNFALPGGARPEDMDLTESPGLLTHKKSPLLLAASVPTK